MSTARIPVDLTNPGQVFACLGFLEAADLLLGDAEGGFDWEGGNGVAFVLKAAGDENPTKAVLEFLATAQPIQCAPVGYSEPPPKKGSNPEADDEAAEDEADPDNLATPELELTATFPAKEADRMALPIRLCKVNLPRTEIGHWADGSSRESFKLYAGNRSAHRIAVAMLQGVRAKPKKHHKQEGELKTRGLNQLWRDDPDLLVKVPLDVLTPIGGSFNFDPRGAWTAIDAGYSPNKHKHAIQASPVLEFLAAWGLEHARPLEFAIRRVRYFAWTGLLPPCLARLALCGGLPAVRSRHFRFELDLSGKNKVVTYAQEEFSE